MKTKSKKVNSKIVEKNNFYTKYKRYIPTLIVLILVVGILVYLAAVRQDTIAGEAIRKTVIQPNTPQINSKDISVLIIPKTGYTITNTGSIIVNKETLDRINGINTVQPGSKVGFCACVGCGYDCSCDEGCDIGCPPCDDASVMKVKASMVNNYK